MPDFSRRLQAAELMDDLTRPDSEFEHAYRELETINRRLGGLRAILRFLPPGRNLSILDVAAGGCDIGEALMERPAGKDWRVVSLDLNMRGLRRASRTLPVVGNGLQLPFADGCFDAVLCSLSFHHLTDEECVGVLREMWRVARGSVIVNDLNRHRVAYAGIRILSRLFSTSVMVRHDGPVSVLRALQPGELEQITRRAGVPGKVYRSFPFRIVLVAKK